MSWLIYLKKIFKIVVRVKKLTKNLYHQKFIQLISRHLVRKTGYEAGIVIVRLLSKASNTGFLLHIKPPTLFEKIPGGIFELNEAQTNHKS